MFAEISMPGSEERGTASKTTAPTNSSGSPLANAIGTTLATCGSSVAGLVELEAAVTAPAGPLGLVIDGLTLGMGVAGCIVTATTTMIGAATNDQATLSLAANIPGYASLTGLVAGTVGAVVDGQQGFDLGVQIGSFFDDARGFLSDQSKLGDASSKASALTKAISLLGNDYSFTKDMAELMKELEKGGTPYTGPDPGEDRSFDDINAPGQTAEHPNIEIARDDGGHGDFEGGFSGGGYAGGGERDGIGDDDHGSALA